MACGISVPRPGIEPVPPAVEAQSLNHWTTREAPLFISFYYLLFIWLQQVLIVLHSFLLVVSRLLSSYGLQALGP